MVEVSVIVPVYNGELYIDKLIESILAQTFKDFELIIVDDGSKDGTKEVVKKYQKKDKRIKYIYQKNMRQGAARNNGLKHAKGNYTLFVDSDDLVEKNYIEELHTFITKEEKDIVLCDYDWVYPNGNNERSYGIIDYKDKYNITIQEYFVSAPSPCNKIFKTSFLKDNHFEFAEGIFYEDYATIPALAVYSPKIGYLDKVLYHYIQTSSSTTRNEEYKSYQENIFEATDILYNLVKDTPELHDELEGVIIEHLLYASSVEFNRFHKYKNIDRISEFMHKYFPKYKNNKYYKQNNLKYKILCYLFYKRKYKTIQLMLKIKKAGR